MVTRTGGVRATAKQEDAGTQGSRGRSIVTVEDRIQVVTRRGITNWLSYVVNRLINERRINHVC